MIAKSLPEKYYQQNEGSIFYVALPVKKHKTRDKKQYKQEILVFKLMETVSLKHHIWRYQIDHAKFQPLH